MRWDRTQLAGYVGRGLSDREIAAQLGTSLKAVETARYRFGLSAQQPCQNCQRMIPAGQRRLCDDCLERLVALYLASTGNVEHVAQELGLSVRTLERAAVRIYGMTRAAVSPLQRMKIREVLRGKHRG